MINYPSQLPGPNLDGYALRTVSPLMRVDMQSGRARQRRRFTNVPTEAQMSWVMTEEQGQLFAGFYRYTIRDGADWFLMPLKTELGYGDYECRFTDIYDGPRPFAFNKYSYTATLEIRYRQTIPAEAIEFPDYIIESEIFDIAMNELWPAA